MFNAEIEKMMNYHNITEVTYAPLTKEWCITDSDGNTQNGVFENEDNDCLSYCQGDEEWFKTLDLENRIELVISPCENLSHRTTENIKERYDGVVWSAHLQHFGGVCEVFKNPNLKLKIILDTMNNEYAAMVDMVRTRHKESITEADTNPDKWFELFVNQGDAGTHTVESADSFDELTQHIERYVEQYGFDNINIDIWENREHPNNLIGLFDTQIRKQSDIHRLDQNYLARVCLWVNNYGDGEGLTRELFAETYGKVMGNHYAVKWESDYRHNILAMVNYFGYGSKDGQLFCDMIMKQMAKYEQRINDKRNGR